MMIEKFDRWFSILTNISVVLGLVFLAFELRQATESLALSRTTLVNEFSAKAESAIRDVRISIAQSEETASIWLRGCNGEELSAIETVRYHQLVESFLMAIRDLYFSHRGTKHGTDWIFKDIIDVELKGRPGLAHAFLQYTELRRSNSWTERLAESARSALPKNNLSS